MLFRCRNWPFSFAPAQLFAANWFSIQLTNNETIDLSQQIYNFIFGLILHQLIGIRNDKKNWSILFKEPNIRYVYKYIFGLSPNCVSKFQQPWHHCRLGVVMRKTKTMEGYCWLCKSLIATCCKGKQRIVIALAAMFLVKSSGFRAVALAGPGQLLRWERRSGKYILKPGWSSN